MRSRATYLSSAILALLFLLSVSPLDAIVQGEAATEPEGERLTAEAATRFVEEIGPMVEELRGLEFKRPVPVKLIDEEELRAYVVRRIESFQNLDQIRDLATAYELLGLLPEGTDILQLYLDAMGEQAGGFYDPPSGCYYLLDEMPAELGRLVAAHELTHALEDQHFGLDERLRAALDDDDRILALSAVHEGSATLLMYDYLAKATLNNDVDADALEAYADAEVSRMASMDAIPPVLLRQLVAPYVLGASFLSRGNMLASIAKGYPTDDINLAYENGPLSSEQVMHPAKYWDSEQRDDPQRLSIGDAGEVLGPRWRKRLDGVLGEMTLGLMVGAPTPGMMDGLMLHIGAQWTNAAAMGWGGDRWELWVRGDSSLVLLGTIWDSAADAEEFATALKESSGLRWKLAGDRVAVVAGEAGKKSDKLLDLILTSR
jgi:hypothetical protein